jgi:cyclophilin family peptidyl-prolyl cis-trans isomerase
MVLPAVSVQPSYRPKKGETVLVLTVKNRGEVVILLETAKAPKTTSHIIKLAEKDFYKSQRFHRVEKTPRPYLVQIGDPKTKTISDMSDPKVGEGGSGAQIAYEDSGLKNVKGAVGLAALRGQRRKGDSQFYILLGDQRFLDGNYTVFGNVVSGMNVVQKIQLGDQVTSAAIKRG